MSGRPKFSIFQAWAQPSPSKKTNGDMPDSLSLLDSDERDRQVNIKLTVFFVVVALLFVLAEHLGRVQESTDPDLGQEFHSTCEFDRVTSTDATSGKSCRVLRAVPPKQQREPCHLLSDKRSDTTADRTTCYPNIAVSGVDELIQCIETAGAPGTGIYRLESHVD